MPDANAAAAGSTTSTATSGRGSELAWSGATLRMPPWLWLNLAAMAVATLHILIDFGIGLFSLAGRLAVGEATLLVLIALIHVWWAVSFAAGAQGNGAGVAGVAVLASGWTLLTNGYPIVFCPPTCAEAAPLSDVAHVGSLLLGTAASLVAAWSLWRTRARISPVLPVVALLLVVATLVAFPSTDS